MLRIAVICLVITAMFSAGCLGGRETDEVVFALSIGIDRASDREILVTYRLAIPAGLVEGKGGGSSETSMLVTIKAVNLAEARNLLNSIMPRDVNLSHVKTFVVSEEYARKGLGDLISVVNRFREFRGTMFIAVVRGGTAEEFFRNNDPKSEPLVSKYYEGMFQSAPNSGYYMPSLLHEFIVRWKNKGAAPYAVLMGINPLTGEGKEEGETEPGEGGKEYKATQMPRKSNNPAEMLGTAVFRQDKMVGELNSHETRAVSILQGRFGQGYMIIDDPEAEGKRVNIRIRLGRKPKITCQLKEGKAKYTADVLLEGEVTNISSGVHYESTEYSGEIEAIISRIIEKEISATLRKTQLLGSDIVGFGEYARRYFATHQDFIEQNMEELYQTAEIQLKVSTQIRRTGLIWKTVKVN